MRLFLLQLTPFDFGKKTGNRTLDQQKDNKINKTRSFNVDINLVSKIKRWVYFGREEDDEAYSLRSRTHGVEDGGGGSSGGTRGVSQSRRVGERGTDGVWSKRQCQPSVNEGPRGRGDLTLGEESSVSCITRNVRCLPRGSFILSLLTQPRNFWFPILRSRQGIFGVGNRSLHCPVLSLSFRNLRPCKMKRTVVLIGSVLRVGLTGVDTLPQSLSLEGSSKL